MFKAFILFIVITAFGAVLVKAARWLLDFLLVLLAAAAVGTLVGRWVSSDATTATAAGVLVFAVLIPGLWKLRNHLRRERSACDRWEPPVSAADIRDPVAEETPPPASSGKPENAWDRLKEAVPEFNARLAVSERSFERFRASTDGKLFDAASHETLIMIDRRLPELIETELASNSTLSSTERRRAFSELVDIAEDLAADCERQLSAHDQRAEQVSAIRLHIKRYLEGRRSGTL